jgi:hypothetical protein
MRTEEEIKARIAELEELDDPEGDCYLSEGEQAELMTLYWVLGDGNF